MTVRDDIARYRRNLQGEVDSAAMYRAMADLERQPERADVYRRLAAVEETHASFWLNRLAVLGAPQCQLRPAWRTFSGSTINANSNGASNAAGGTLIFTGYNLFIGNGSNVAGSLTRVGMQ